MNAPTPEEFLTAVEPDEDTDDLTPLEHLADLERRVTALEGGTQTLSFPAEQVSKLEQGREVTEQLAEAGDVEWLSQQLSDLDAKHMVLTKLVEEITGIVKKSTSKVSLEVKAAIDAWANPALPETEEGTEPATEPTPELEVADDAPTSMGGFVGQPTHDAPVEAWRSYARILGHGRTGPAFNELEAMNRSQIRTLLGIEQPASAGS